MSGPNRGPFWPKRVLLGTISVPKFERRSTTGCRVMRQERRNEFRQFGPSCTVLSAVNFVNIDFIENNVLSKSLKN
jgi:hypothetical protein